MRLPAACAYVQACVRKHTQPHWGSHLPTHTHPHTPLYSCPAGVPAHGSMRVVLTQCWDRVQGLPDVQWSSHPPKVLLVTLSLALPASTSMRFNPDCTNSASFACNGMRFRLRWWKAFLLLILPGDWSKHG